MILIMIIIIIIIMIIIIIIIIIIGYDSGNNIENKYDVASVQTFFTVVRNINSTYRG
jgi:preprotein translocase subunit SecG